MGAVRSVILTQKMPDVLQHLLDSRVICGTRFNQCLHAFATAEGINSNLCCPDILRRGKALPLAFVRPVIADLIYLTLEVKQNIAVELYEA